MHRALAARPHRKEMRTHTARGFTLVELMIVVAIVALMAGVAIPRFIGARRSANEVAAIATLRAVFASQTQVQASGAIDTDADGLGDFAYFAELSGTVPARISVGGAPAGGLVGVHEIEPAPLLQALGSVSNGVVTRSGYVFQMWLPANAGPGPIAGLAEDVGGGKTAAPFPDPQATEQRFCAYGWPARAGITGLRCFFVNQEGVILETAMRGGGAYSGVGGGPNFDAAFSVGGDMSSDFARGAPGVDGNTWLPVQ
jgi:prepilin-type N-terminal cleavage/methylation domain-containing protein